jgi:gliding motility-associated-like protein
VKKRNLLFLSLLFAIISILAERVNGQSPTGCSPFLRQKDTIICSGSSVTLNLKDPPPPDSLLPGVWKLLIKHNAIDSILFNIRPLGYDAARQYLYSVNHQKIIRFDLKNNLVSSITADNWPGDFTEFTFDYTNNRLLAGPTGRDNIFAIPAGGGSWNFLGAGSIDRESFGASTFWNPVTKQPGIYGGYGFNQMKNWIFENNILGWQQKKGNAPIDSVPPKGGNLVATNSDGSKLYLFSGQGSYTGDELTGSCDLGSPWATSSGMFCWLRDLWELDLGNYTFRNILPVNNQSIQYEGAVAYDYDKARFYLFGGYQPTNNSVTNQTLPNTNKTFRFRRNIDAGFSQFTGDGDTPPPAASGFNGTAYYDPVGKRMIWARYDGIWAYYPDSSAVPLSAKSFVWSTGDTTAAITVTPTQTTVYKITRTVNATVCSDSIRITLPDMKTALQHTVSICADSTILDAGSGFTAYAWSTGATTETIAVKQTGNYFVTVSKGSCNAKDTSKVQIAPPVLDFALKNQKDSICSGDADSLFVLSPQAGVTYSWYVPGSSTIINIGAGYLTRNITKDADFIVSATSTPAVCISKSAITHVTIRKQFTKPVFLADSVLLSTIIFRWNPVPDATSYLVSVDKGISYASPSSGSDLRALSHTVTGLQPNQTVSIAVKAIGPYSCQTSDTVQHTSTTLNPFGDGIYVPNAFTPNGDGVNDVLLVYGTAIVSVKLMVYNQWGTQLFLSTDINKGWDGTNNGKNAPAGVYTYAMEAIMQDGKRVTKSGSFTLMR